MANPWTVAVWFNGWLVGFVDPFGGLITAGKLANEAALVEALEKALGEVEKAGSNECAVA
jgi:hypothetical protein